MLYTEVNPGAHSSHVTPQAQMGSCPCPEGWDKLKNKTHNKTKQKYWCLPCHVWIASQITADFYAQAGDL